MIVRHCDAMRCGETKGGEIPATSFLLLLAGRSLTCEGHNAQAEIPPPSAFASMAAPGAGNTCAAGGWHILPLSAMALAIVVPPCSPDRPTTWKLQRMHQSSPLLHKSNAQRNECRPGCAYSTMTSMVSAVASGWKSWKKSLTCAMLLTTAFALLLLRSGAVANSRVPRPTRWQATAS